MDFYIGFAAGTLSGIALTEIGFRLRVSYLVWKRDQEEKMIAEVTSANEVLKDFRATYSMDVAYDSMSDLVKLPPNVGGEGNRKYDGPNYVTPEEVVEDLQHLQHFGVIKEGDEDFTLPQEYAHEFRMGGVTPDGMIWTGPTALITYGKVLVHIDDAKLAYRFNWRFAGEGPDEFVYIERIGS